MHIRQLITVLGLCLSQSRAGAISPPHDDSIKSFVMYITQPDAPLEKSSVFTSVADVLHPKASDAQHHQFHHEFHHAVTPILHNNAHEAAYIVDSYVGFRQTLAATELRAHPEVRAKRLQAYRNSLYSQFSNLAEKSSSKSSAKGVKQAYEKLILLWRRQHAAHHSHQSASPEAILEKLQQEIAHSVTPKSEVELEKLTREQINHQLESTQMPGVPDAVLIDGKTAQAIFGPHSHHMHHPHQFHAAVPAAQPVTVAA